MALSSIFPVIGVPLTASSVVKVKFLAAEPSGHPRDVQPSLSTFFSASDSSSLALWWCFLWWCFFSEDSSVTSWAFSSFTFSSFTFSSLAAGTYSSLVLSYLASWAFSSLASGAFSSLIFSSEFSGADSSSNGASFLWWCFLWWCFCWTSAFVSIKSLLLRLESHVMPWAKESAANPKIYFFIICIIIL